MAFAHLSFCASISTLLICKRSVYVQNSFKNFLYVKNIFSQLVTDFDLLCLFHIEICGLSYNAIPQYLS